MNSLNFIIKFLVSLNNTNTEQADYTIVFARVAGAGKSTAGNFFLNKKAFSSKGGVLCGSKICSARTATIYGKTVKIIDTLAFLMALNPQRIISTN